MTSAVTGIGAVTAVGVGVDALSVALRSGTSGIQPHMDEQGRNVTVARLPGFDFEADAAALGLPNPVAKRLRRIVHRAPPGLAAALGAAAEAWHMAGLEGLDPARVGLIVAGSNLTNQTTAQHCVQAPRRRIPPSYAIRYCDFDHVGTISEALGIRGEGYTVGGASASGGVAIRLAQRALGTGELDAVVVVGAPTMLSHLELEALDGLGALHPGPATTPPAAACRPFDARACGFVYGQGASALVLEPTGSTAAKAWLVGTGMRLDANRQSNPDLTGEVACMRAALRDSELAPEDVTFVNAHATSTRLGDEVEADAIAEVFGRSPWVNATKPITGHCIGAAGVLEAVATIIQLDEGFVHGNINLDHPILDLRFVGRDALSVWPEVGVTNSFGFGGVNTTSVFLASR